MVVMSRVIGGVLGLVGAILMLVPAGLTVAAIMSMLEYLGYIGYLPAEAQALIWGIIACVILALIMALIALGGSIRILTSGRGSKMLIAGSVLYLIFGVIVPLAVAMAILGGMSGMVGLGLDWKGILGIVGFILGLVGGIIASRAEAPAYPPAPAYAPPAPPPPPPPR